MTIEKTINELRIAQEANTERIARKLEADMDAMLAQCLRSMEGPGECPSCFEMKSLCHSCGYCAHPGCHACDQPDFD